MADNRIVTKGKILSKKIEMEYLQGENRDEIKFTSKQPPHADLQAAFDALAVHSAFIGEFIGDDEVKIEKTKTKDQRHKYEAIRFSTPELSEEFTLTGFSTHDEGNSVILTAHRTLSTGQVLNFNTPSVRAAAEGSAGYLYWQDLEDKIRACQAELKMFLDGKTREEEKPVDNTIKMDFSQSPEQAARIKGE